MRDAGPDGTNRWWVSRSIEVGIGRAMGLNPVGGRFSIAATRIGLPAAMSLTIAPGIDYGGYFYPKALFKSEIGKPITGAALGSLRVEATHVFGNGRRMSVGGNHIFLTDARTTLGLSYAW